MKHSQATIALIVSEFNQEITQELWQGAYNHLIANGFKHTDLVRIDVPGAFEIPLVAQQIAKTQIYTAIIALGAVIRGETSHYDYVCQAVTHGCLRVGLDFDIPVIFGVLTTENEQQAWDRLGGAHGHKGVYAAECAIKMQQVLKQL